MAKTVVIKVGTATLTGGKEGLDEGYMADLVGQLCRVIEEGWRVVLVTSGAIREGMRALRLRPPLSLSEKQAAAAVGQTLLMHRYRDFFSRYHRQIGQVLLTRTDVENRARFRNARRTFQQLFRWGIIPIVNENDTVATEEIQFGDNDLLTALTALIVDADLVILLSDVDGFLVRGKVIPEVRVLTDELWRQAGRAGRLGTGGMVSKLQAAEVTMNCGIPLIVANGRHREVIVRIVRGERVGTYFVPRRYLPARKRWLAFAPRTHGQIIVNEGAKEKIVKHGSSLLAVGIVRVIGDFEAKEVVTLADEEGAVFAKGIVNHPADRIRQITGLPTHQVVRILGGGAKPEIIHRDNLVVLE